MFESSIILLDCIGIVVFTVTGALVASRNQMDLIGFILLGTITGIGGGTIRDLLLDAHPILWIERPQYLGVCILVSIVVFLPRTSQLPVIALSSGSARLVLRFSQLPELKKL